jgi:ABC-type Fe3+/spermidine/putrescine transport system ATPase subunit
MTMLAVTGLTAGYGGAAAVRDLDLEIQRSEFLTLLGPSGCGKTTTLRCVAGLHTPERGAIHLDGRCVHSDAVRVPAHKRDINMVFQSYAVWPHMTTLQNVAYGLKAKRLARREVEVKARRMLELVGLEEYAHRHATELSGGQQQRVALARALATEPKLVLMDEPLSNLDARLRARMRHEIREVQRATGTTVLYVTHDQDEALSMSDRVVVMSEGAIQQAGDPWSLYNRPANRFVATFLGEANIVDGTVTGRAGDHFAVRAGDTAFRVALAAGETAPAIGDEVSLVFRPEWVALGAGAGNRLSAQVVSTEFLGDHFDCRYRWGAHTLRVHAVTAPSSLRPEVGATHELAIAPENLAWFPRSAGRRVPELGPGLGADRHGQHVEEQPHLV